MGLGDALQGVREEEQLRNIKEEQTAAYPVGSDEAV